MVVGFGVRERTDMVVMCIPLVVVLMMIIRTVVRNSLRPVLAITRRLTSGEVWIGK